MPTPCLILVTGRPGAGKSTLAEQLGRQLHLPVVSRDALKEGFVHTCGKPHDELPAETNRLVTELFFRTIQDLVAAGVSLIAEAAFQHPVWASHVTPLKALARVVILVCRVDAGTAAARMLRRSQEDPLRGYFHGSLKEAQTDQEYEEPCLDVPTIYVDTTGVMTPSAEVLAAQLLDDWL